MSIRNETFLLSCEELDNLYGTGPLAFSIYVWMRSWMDERTGLVGVLYPISLPMLGMYCETHTPKGQGQHIAKPSEQNIRTAIERLKRVGLIRSWKGHAVAFELPLAKVGG